jgi:ubiquinone biosynthesis protein
MDLATIGKLDRSLRTARRYQELVTILAKHGFASFMTESGVGQWLKREFNVSLSSNGSHSTDALSREVRMRKVIEDLGPTFIKVGQILSTRPDLIPQSFADELKHLQSNVEPVPFESIQDVLKAEFPGMVDLVFQEINPEPLAAASLAQVHEARLVSGQQVVIKVLKPGVEELIEADIGVIHSLGEFLARNFKQSGFQPKEVAEEFARQLKREIDLLQEARSTKRLASYFENHETISFPRVYSEASTQRVLTLEKVEGRLLSRVDLSTLSIEDRRQVIAHGADAVFKQCFEHGFFHADPHPGNIFILPANRVCFIDCGMTGSIDKQTAELLARLIYAAVNSQLDTVINVSLELAGGDRSLAHDRVLRNQVWEFISRFQDSSFESLQIGQLLSDFFALLRRAGLHCPADIVYLIKAVTTIEGVAEELDPSFDIVTFARPHLEAFLKDRLGPAAIAKKAEEAIKDYAGVFAALPIWLKDIASKIRTGDLPIAIRHEGLEDFTRSMQHAGNSISTALIASALLIGSSILVLADRVSGQSSVLGQLGLAGFIAAIVIVAVIFWNNVFGGPKKG